MKMKRNDCAPPQLALVLKLGHAGMLYCYEVSPRGVEL